MERQRHMQLYTHWNARDNYRYGAKKKKRKRDKSDDPGGCAASQQITAFRLNVYLSASLLFYYFLKHSIFQWHNLSKLEQAKYYEMAKNERQAHQSKELCS